MAYTLDIDPDARAQIQALPPTARTALGDAMTVLSLVPERGQPLNANNPDGGLYQLVFGDGFGLITYLLLTDQNRVDVLVVTWMSFD
jgi:mRNA-degrading endonuclease RelE of RelBE toxin-antitoxin system